MCLRGTLHHFELLHLTINSKRIDLLRILVIILFHEGHFFRFSTFMDYPVLIAFSFPVNGISTHKKKWTFNLEFSHQDQVAPSEQQEGVDVFRCQNDDILQSSAKGDADKRLKFMMIIYTIASDRFGCVEPL